MRASRTTRRIAMAWMACLGACGALASPAPAAVSHVYSHTIGSASSSPAAPYPLSAPTDVAVDQATGDVYVTDTGNHRVQKFDAAGNFVLMFGKEVDKTSGGNICTAASGHTCQPGAVAGSLGGFEEATLLAVDNYSGGNGDLYVADKANGTVQKFHSDGSLVLSWGVNGQKNGSDAKEFPGFAGIAGLAVGGSCATPPAPKIGNCGPRGSLYVTAQNPFYNMKQYTREGEYISRGTTFGPQIKVDAEANYYVATNYVYGDFFETPIYKFIPTKGTTGEAEYYEMATDRPTRGFEFDPATHELYQVTGTRTEEESHPPRVNHYDADCNPPTTDPCDPADSFGAAQLSDPKGLAVDGSSHSIYIANHGNDEVLVFTDARPIVTTEEANSVTDTSVTLTGNVDPAGRGDISECRFEYGIDTSYGNVLPCVPDPGASPPGSHFTTSTDVTALLSGLSPGTTLHYRLAASSVIDASSVGGDRTFRTTAPPAITGLAAERLTATSADLIARINPNGRDTHYRIEYGTTPEYGQAAPVPDGVIAASYQDQPIEVKLTGLTPHAVYHYSLTAENDSGVTTVEDHTFNFYPPSCPNENVRQQTEANFLPDCRAYELVSPANAGGTQLFPAGPNTGRATTPSRFSYTGLFATIPGSGGQPSDTSGDLYVATRTSTGWVSHYVGWPASETAISGGPPMGPPGSTPGAIDDLSNMGSNGLTLIKVAAGVLTDSGMNRFLAFKSGAQSPFDLVNRTPIGSNAPRVYAADGTYLERWPTNLDLVPDGEYPVNSWIFPHGGNPLPEEKPATVAPGGARALDCPTVSYEAAAITTYANYCPGDVTASADLNHYVFATSWHVFAPGGQIGGAGSVYDNDTGTGEVTVASKNPSGDNIQPEPGDKAGDPLQIPAVSPDGSRILMAAGATGPCGFASCPTPPCAGALYANRCTMQPSHLYMRVNGSFTYDVSHGNAVDYVGTDHRMDRVYFLSDDRLTADDLDSSTDLYLWRMESDSLTRLSRGNNAGNAGEPGNSDACQGGIATSHGLTTSKCGVATYTQWFYCAESGGGNCLSDNSIAGDTGEIYFFSPEQLDGTRGIPNQQNLYVTTADGVQYVTTLTGPPTCFNGGLGAKFCQRVLRMQVTPDNSHMAFVTASPVTQYDNDHFKQVYRYAPARRELVCVSCLPSGDPPTVDARASLNGLFMTDDGRTFFTTDDPLVHVDTNAGQDVYEYVEGRPQLVTQGTGDTRDARTFPFTEGRLQPAVPGLVGVSADGTDVFFGTFDTLARQDKNGLFLKFYDARSGGGFPAPAPPPPCAAADECHGVASAPPPPVVNGTGTATGSGGNVAHGKRKPRKRVKKRGAKRRKHDHRRAGR